MNQNSENSISLKGLLEKANSGDKQKYEHKYEKRDRIKKHLRENVPFIQVYILAQWTNVNPLFREIANEVIQEAGKSVKFAGKDWKEKAKQIETLFAETDSEIFYY